MGDFVVQGTRFFIPRITVGGELDPPSFQDWSTFALEDTFTGVGSTFDNRGAISNDGARYVVGENITDTAYIRERTGTTWSTLSTITETAGEFARSQTISGDGSTVAISEGIGLSLGINNYYIYTDADNFTNPVDTIELGRRSNADSSALSLDGSVFAHGNSADPSDFGNGSSRFFGRIRYNRNVGGSPITTNVQSGNANNQRLGFHLDMSDDGLVVVSHKRPNTLVKYRWDGNDFIEDATVNISGGTGEDSISISGNFVAVSCVVSGGFQVRIYRIDQNGSLPFVQSIALTSDTRAGDVSLAQGGKHLVFGQPLYDGAESNQGRVQIYQADDIDLATPTYSLVNTIDTPNPVSSGQYGSVAQMSEDGTRLMVTAPTEDRVYVYRAGSV